MNLQREMARWLNGYNGTELWHVAETLIRDELRKQSELGAVVFVMPESIVETLSDLDPTYRAPTAQNIKDADFTAIKAEAHRRIVEIIPEWKQRNLLAQAAVLAEKGRGNWTAQELADWNAGATLWAQVTAIRNASDQIEAMTPIPQDYTDEKYWGSASASS